ncbi:hypothetical protein BT96DRAFT_1043280 [Gymnopus androsaceus JB14]|uniref:SWIM-type domain-containing protein n=1 Tax=Gymnopus androsaceus JB14 TaxID=1447944 RepID=A0A6A4HF74_9AGAR|nr:hypothetical protein BT96DRAFT_1043280 [Gymnopus androsaceus JB14]
MSSFDKYMTSGLSVLYLSAYFSNISFRDAVLLSMPEALPQGSLMKWVFLPKIHVEEEALFVSPTEQILAQSDLLPLMSELREAFDAGKRSVAVTIKLESGEDHAIFHFAKSREAVSFSTELLDHIHGTDVFSDECITAPINGFQTSDYPLWKLGTLLHENYVDEEVINSLTELLYLRHGAIWRAFIRAFAFLACLDNHFTAYFYDRTCLEYGDTLDGGATGTPRFALCATQELLKGIDLPQTTTLVKGEVSLQGPASGSCGIGGFIFIERHLDPCVPVWTHKMSGFHWDRLLSDLLLYNMIAKDSLPAKAQWLSPCLTRPLLKAGTAHPEFDTLFDIEYVDYNMSSFHPIHGFFAELQKPISTSRLWHSLAMPVRAPGALDLNSNGFSLDTSHSVVKQEFATIDLTLSLIGPTVEPEPFIINLSLDGLHSAVKPEPFMVDLPLSSDSSRSDVKPEPFIIDLSLDGLHSAVKPEPFMIHLPLSSNSSRLVVKPELCTIDLTLSPPLNACIAFKTVPDDDCMMLNPQPAVSHQAPVITDTILAEGAVFKGWEEACTAIYDAEEKLSHIWKTDQSKKDGGGQLKKVTLQCHYSGHHVPCHFKVLDPSDHWQGRSIKMSCTAYININCVQPVERLHNHDREIPMGGTAPKHPLSSQKELVASLATSSMSRSQLSKVLQHHLPGNPLEPRQEGQNWCYDILLNTEQKVVEQVKLVQRYWDLLLNDNSYNQNHIAIGGDGMSRNVWYAFHESKDIDTHNWVWRCHLDAAGHPPLCLFINHHPSLIASATITMPLTDQIYCLHHLDGNIAQHLCPALGSEWQNFSSEFWDVYRAVSPSEFDLKWARLLERFPHPTVLRYLEEEIYPCRDRWAWAWIGTRFTAGIRTTGRPELLSGSRKTFFQVFESSRRQYPTHVEQVFRPIIELLRLHAGPFALQKSWTEMDKSVFYNVEVIQRPPGADGFDGPGFKWKDNEEKNMFNQFDNDTTYISTSHLLHLLGAVGIQVTHLLRVVHLSEAGASHILAVLSDGRVVCDCCMGINLGIPCRHFFTAWLRFSGLGFHLSMIHSRWYQDDKLKVEDTPTITFNDKVQPLDARLSSLRLPAVSYSNPFETLSTPDPPTQTLGAWVVHEEATAALQPLLSGIHTADDLSELLEGLHDIW